MDKKKAKEFLPIITALAEGKTIQVLNDYSVWVNITNPEFNRSASRYRIKPEPKYVPYSNKKELLKDSIKHGGYVKHRFNNCFYFIESIYDNVIEIPHKGNVSYQDFFNEYTWADDDSPCGILMSEEY